MKAKPKRVASPSVGADDFKLEEFLPYRLSVAAHRVSRLFARRYSDDFGLSIPEWRVMSTVGRFGSLSPSAVGERADMDKVKVSRAAASLVARGLLRQSADPRDGRARLLRLTRKGTSVHDSMVPLARELEAMLSQGLGRNEWASLNRALVRLEHHARAMEESDEAEPE